MRKFYLFQYYNAEITAITEKTYVVQFKGYGNTEEVLKTDCLPVKNKNYYSSTSSNNNTRKSYNQFSGNKLEKLLEKLI